MFLVAVVCGTVGICLDQAGIALGRPSGSVTRYLLGGVVMLAGLPVAAAMSGRTWSAGAAFAAAVSSVVLCLTGAAHQELGRLPLPRPGPHRQPASPRRGGRAEPPPDPDRATSRAAGPGPRPTWSRRRPRRTGIPPGCWCGSPTWCPSRWGWCSSPKASADPASSGRPCGRGSRRAWSSGGAAVLLAVLAHPLLAVIGAEYADASATALRVLTLGLIPFAVWQCYNARCRATGQVRRGSWRGWSWPRPSAWPRSGRRHAARRAGRRLGGELVPGRGVGRLHRPGGSLS